MKFVEHKTSVATKKGNNDGTTLFAHNKSPDLEASRLDFENITKQTASITKINGKLCQ